MGSITEAPSHEEREEEGNKEAVGEEVVEVSERGERVIKTYVWHGEQCFFVSTANRNSSAAFAHDSRYAETLVWKYDWREVTCVGNIVAQASGAEDSIKTHLLVIEALHKTGRYDD